MNEMQANGRQPVIVTEGATKLFGEVGARDITLTVPEGTLLGLIGPSGSGKTTIVRLLTGVYKPDRGQLRVLGEDPRRLAPRTRARIGYMPQHYVLSPRMSVTETLNFTSSLYGMSWFTRRRRLREVLEFVELYDHRRQIVGKLSGGMQRRLALASMLAHDPTLMFADEPTAGIDPVLRRKFWDHFRALSQSGRTLLVTTQYVSEASYCDYVAVLRDGQLLMINTPEGLRRQALGGDAFALQLRPDAAEPAARLISTLPFVRGVRHSRSQAGRVYVTVDDRNKAVPDITRRLAEAGIKVEASEEYQPSFDDVFVALMHQVEDGQSPNGAAAHEEAEQSDRIH
jgi:ABC-2 type transport system ATP-binding protein